MSSHQRTLSGFLAAALVAATAAVLPLSAPVAMAAAGDYGVQDQSYTGAVNAPTADKPQSKLWFAGGLWWADMFDTVSGTWHIFQLDRASQVWTDTGVPIDSRPNTSADTVWDGAHLYVASHVVATSSLTSIHLSQGGNPARLYRYSYAAATGKWSLDPSFPSQISSNSSESLTLDKDSTGKLWATWTQVSGNATAGYKNAVYVNGTTTSDLTWGVPFVVPVAGANPSVDDISALVAFGRNKIGILWSNQLTDRVYWAIHVDGAAIGTWRGGTAAADTYIADDHLNIKSVQSDSQGRVYAVVKTSLDASPTSTPSSPQVNVLIYAPATDTWQVSTFGTLADCHTRPMMMIDDQHSLIHVFATAPTEAGCVYTGEPGTIYEKTASMNNPVFAPGRGTPVIRDSSSPNMNDPTSTKQSVSSASGLIVLASNQATKRYWHADVPLTVPTASFTATPTSGTAPLVVQFSDTSAGVPVSWAWNFGDGTTSTAQNPSHTYNVVGTYTATLTVNNAVGGSTPETAMITVSATASPAVTVAASTTALAATAVTAVTVNAPASLLAGDFLIAQFTADNTPTVATAPTGWSPLLATSLKPGNGANVYVYYHPVTTPSAEPTSYTWQLSSAQKWGAGMTAFRGVNLTSPFDSALSSKVDSTYAAHSISVPSVTTATNGAMLVGGTGADSKNAGMSAPTGWTKAWDSTGGQQSALGYRSRPTAGPSGTATWAMAGAFAVGGWMRALKPTG